MNTAQAFVMLSDQLDKTFSASYRWRSLAHDMGATSAFGPVSRFADGSAVCWTGTDDNAQPIEYVGG